MPLIIHVKSWFSAQDCGRVVRLSLVGPTNSAELSIAGNFCSTAGAELPRSWSCWEWSWGDCTLQADQIHFYSTYLASNEVVQDRAYRPPMNPEIAPDIGNMIIAVNPNEPSIPAGVPANKPPSRLPRLAKIIPSIKPTINEKIAQIFATDITPTLLNTTKTKNLQLPSQFRGLWIKAFNNR
jgi:hypothetical protein